MATAKRVPIASGRACDVFAHGNGLVLRRYREGEPCDTAREAAMMRRAEEAGVPVPHVHEVHPDAQPAQFACVPLEPPRSPLDLTHRRVVDASLTHGDFHPLNVLLPESGPVVIDWSNAAEGPAETDVACRLQDPHLRERELASVRAFLGGFGG